MAQASIIQVLFLYFLIITSHCFRNEAEACVLEVICSFDTPERKEERCWIYKEWECCMATGFRDNARTVAVLSAAVSLDQASVFSLATKDD